MAEFLEKVQWKVRPATLVDTGSLGPPLHIPDDGFDVQEVGKAISKLKRRKASGPDDIPAEYWKALALDPQGLQWIATMVNTCWKAKQIPSEWRHARVSTIYKNKGP
eukprot:9491620-Pyramimonas_sp.AAC.1